MVIECCPAPEFVALVALEGLQFIEIAHLWNFFRLWGIVQLISSLSNPMHDSGVVDLGDTFAPAPHAVQRHFDAQLLDIVPLAPSTVGFEALATTLLALVALPDSTMPVFSGLSCVTLRTFHISIVPNLALRLQQRQIS